ncbi:MAG TPA: hypothetical protein PLD27_09345 [bacterium]|nr:hypothetical protein [bacterium]HOL47294.1 hypothetical protein [bacterium]HPQ19756.1 hypothetical protein [bacterium]
MHKESNNKSLIIFLCLIFLHFFNINLISVENRDIKENYDDLFFLNDEIFKNDLFLKDSFKSEKKDENNINIEKKEVEKRNFNEIKEEKNIKEEEAKEQLKEIKEDKKSKTEDVTSKIKKTQFEKIKEKVDKKNKNIKIDEFISFTSNEGNEFEITTEFKEVEKKEKMYKPLVIDNFLDDYNIDINKIINEQIQKTKKEEENIVHYEKLRIAGFSILIISIIISLTLLIYNYRKILLYNLKNLDNEVKMKAQQFYKNLLQTPENYKKKSKKEIIEELRKISRNK